MISYKTTATLLFITLNVQLVYSSGTQESSPSDKPELQAKKTARTPGEKNMLRDATITGKPVEVHEGNSSEEVSTSQGPLVPQVNEFEELIRQENYKEIIEAGKSMNNEEFLKQLCPVVETLEQYNELLSCLKDRKMVASFYVRGDIRVVKEAITAEARTYDQWHYFRAGNLENALPLALKEGNHDCVIGLLDIRKGMTAEKDKQLKRVGEWTSFEMFVDNFLAILSPWDDSMAFKQFLTFRGDELRHKHPDILDALCQELVSNLRLELPSQNAKELLTDLIGQPSLLTSVTFPEGFLRFGIDKYRSSFMEYAWREAIKEGLKSGYEFGGEVLWRVLTKDLPVEFPRKYPPTAIELAAVLKKFSTKHELEVQWIMRNAPDFIEKFNEFVACDLLPKVLQEIIFEYVRPTWIDIPSTKSQ